MSNNMNQKDNLISLFTKYVLRNIMSMIGLSCYILADTLFIANGIGNHGLTALNLVLPVYSLLNGLGLMIGMGAATRYSVLSGEGNRRQANKIFTNAVYIAAVLSVIFTLAGILFTPDIVRLLGADQSVQPLANSYLRTILSFSLAFTINNVLVCFVRNDNNPGLSMLAMLGGSFSNIILDYVFIYIFNWGMFGAAFATGLAPIISMIILSKHFIQRKNQFKFVKTSFKINLLKTITALGLPSFITEFSSGIIMLFINFTILRISGNIGVAAYGIVANLALIAVAVFTGIAQGIQPIVSANYGAGEYGNVKKIYKYGVLLAIIIGAAMFTVGILFSTDIIQFFNRDNNKELIRLAEKGIKIYFTAFFIMGINIVTTSYYASIEKAIPSFVISISRGCAAVIPAILIMAEVFGMNGVWMSIPVAEVVTLFFSLYLLKTNRLKEDKEKRLSTSKTSMIKNLSES